MKKWIYVALFAFVLELNAETGALLSSYEEKAIEPQIQKDRVVVDEIIYNKALDEYKKDPKTSFDRLTGEPIK